MNTGLQFLDKSIPPVDFWNPTADLSANTVGNWWIGLTRDSPGVADIAIGAKRDMVYQIGVISKGTSYPNLLHQVIPVTWITEESANAILNDNGSDNEQESDVKNADDLDTNDRDVNDDGATTNVTFFGATVITAIVSLLF